MLHLLQISHLRLRVHEEAPTEKVWPVALGCPLRLCLLLLLLLLRGLLPVGSPLPPTHRTLLVSAFTEQGPQVCLVPSFWLSPSFSRFLLATANDNILAPRTLPEQSANFAVATLPFLCPEHPTRRPPVQLYHGHLTEAGQHLLVAVQGGRGVGRKYE